MNFFCFQKVELPAYSSTKHSHIAHQIRVAHQAEPSCDIKIGNLQGLKVGSDVLLDNFLNILDRMNLKYGIHATQDCQLGHRYDTRGFLSSKVQLNLLLVGSQSPNSSVCIPAILKLNKCF